MNVTTLTRQLGKSGIEVSAMGLGCWAIGGPFWMNGIADGWGEVDDDESIRAIHRALELGVNFFDTADAYGTGHSERVLARALNGRHDQVVIATKFSYTYDEDTRQLGQPDASPDYIRRACEASLRRLHTDYIDLYQFHWGDCDIERAGAARETLEALVAEGKIRYYGWSTDDPLRARFFAEGAHCAAIQHQMNVLDDAAPMLAVCEELDLASINRGPLAMGLLTGKYGASSTLPIEDVRGNRAPSWTGYFSEGKPNPLWLRKLDAVRAVLTSDGRTLAQGALAWLWARSEQTLPIPGFKTVAQIEENCAAMQFGALTHEQMREIDALLEREQP